MKNLKVLLFVFCFLFAFCNMLFSQGLFTEHLVFNDFGNAVSIAGADLDGDGNIDILATSNSPGNKVSWFENDGYQNFTEDTIISNWGQPSSVQAADFNNDGNMDIAAEAWIDELASVYYNDGNENFTEEIISETAYELIKIIVTDLDLDGDHDILGATYAINDIRWWENSLYDVSFGGIPVSGNAPLTVEFTDSTYLANPINQHAWDFNNDGTIDSYVQNTSWIYVKPWIYSVSLEVQTDSLTKKIVYQDYISVGPFVSIEEMGKQTSKTISNLKNYPNPFISEPL